MCRGSLLRIIFVLLTVVVGYLICSILMSRSDMFTTADNIRNGKMSTFRSKYNDKIYSDTLNIKTKDSVGESITTKTGLKVSDNVLNITYKEFEAVYANKWKRSANVTHFPIPSFDHRYEMKCTGVCSAVNMPMFLIVVQTATRNFHKRSIIRQTWGNKHSFKNNTFEIVFIVGKSRNYTIQKLLEEEQHAFNDLVQGTFLDSYRNLTHKSVLGLRWATENCPGVKFLIRVDDDVFVNTFRLIELLNKQYFDLKRHIVGYLFRNGHGVIQRAYGKWKVDKAEFKNMTRYPFTYINGPFGIITGDIILEMFAASKIVPFFWIEDVYIYGMLTDVIGQVEFKPLPGIFYLTKSNKGELIGCFSKTDRSCTKSMAFPVKPEDMSELWQCCADQQILLTRETVRLLTRSASNVSMVETYTIPIQMQTALTITSNYI